MNIYKSIIQMSIIYMIFCLCISNIALAEIRIENYEFGIAGQWRQNSWIPLSFVVKSSNEPFFGKIVAQIDGTSTASMPLNLSYKDLKADTLYLFLNEIAPQITLSLIDTEGNLIDTESFIPEPPKRLEDLVILVITPAKDVLRRLEYKIVESKIPTTKGRIYISYVDSFRNLPRQWVGYNSVDLIIIKDIPLDSIQISHAQQKALVDWVTSGGTLLIPGGLNYQYANRRFIRTLLPVEFIELTSSSELKSLSERFDFDFDGSYSFDLIKTKPKTDSQTIIEYHGTPLIVEREFGDGRVVFMAFDYSVRPFSSEPGFSNFWSWFTNTLAKSDLRKEMVYEPYRRHELKIRNLLASNLSKKTPLIRFAIAFLILYTVSVFCGNFLLKRYTRDAKLIVFVNLVIILIFTAVLLLSQKFWENDILFRNLSIMNLYSETSRARLNSYIGLVGEKSTVHTLEFDLPLFLKGLSSASDLELVQAENFKLNNVHIAPWAMNALHSQTYLDIDGTIKMEQKDKNRIVISNNLPFDLEDVCIIYQEHFDKVEEIAEDSSVKLELKEEIGDSIPPVFGRSELQREFSKIIASEGILGYLSEVKSPILLGWVKRPFLRISSKSYTFSGDTLVVSR